MKNKDIIMLRKAYTKRANNLSKSFCDNNSAGLLLFIESLKFIRDCFIIDSISHGENDTRLAVVATAIAEFDAYMSCDSENKKSFHLDNFCELTKIVMEELLEFNDTV